MCSSISVTTYNCEEIQPSDCLLLPGLTRFNSPMRCVPEGQDVRTLVNTSGVRSLLITHNTLGSFALLPAEGKTRRECFPHLRAQLVGLHFGLFLESVVGVVVCEGILDESGEDEHVANPEVNIQSLDG